MAIDPVELIERQETDSPFVQDLGEELRRLANLPASTDAPYLTMTIDWQPDGMQPNVRHGRRFFDQQRDELLAAHGMEPHTPPHDSLAADLDRIAAFLDGEVDPVVQGVAFMACSARGVFEPLLLGMPLTNRAILAPVPALRVLAKLAEDEPPFAVLLADQKQATLLVIDQASRRQSVDLRATGYPRKQAQGGWSQQRYQNRADERVEAFARTVAEETERELADAGVELLVLAGNEQTMTTLRDTLHPTVQAKVVGMTRMDLTSNEQDVIAATLPIVEEAERAREQEAVRHLENGAGPGGGAVTGPEETLTALQAGQVMTLVLNEELSMTGWADYTFPVYGVGAPPAEHPVGGDPAALVAVPLEEELVRLAIQTDAGIEIVRTRPPVTGESIGESSPGDSSPRTEAARALDAFGGVGALLRFALADDHSTAEL